MVGGWKYKIDDPRWPLSGNTGRKSAVDWIINRKLNPLLQALFFTGYWTSPTNGFGGILSLEKNP